MKLGEFSRDEKKKNISGMLAELFLLPKQANLDLFTVYHHSFINFNKTTQFVCFFPQWKINT